MACRTTGGTVIARPLTMKTFAGEPGLLRGDVGSTAAFALLIRLQDPRPMVPKDRARRADGALVMRVR